MSVRCSPKTFSAPVIPVSNFTTTPQVSETTDLVPVHRVDNQPVNEVSPVRSKIQKRRCVQNGKGEKIIYNIPITFMLYVSSYESPASRRRSSRVTDLRTWESNASQKFWMERENHAANKRLQVLTIYFWKLQHKFLRWFTVKSLASWVTWRLQLFCCCSPNIMLIVHVIFRLRSLKKLNRSCPKCKVKSKLVSTGMDVLVGTKRVTISWSTISILNQQLYSNQPNIQMPI